MITCTVCFQQQQQQQQHHIQYTQHSYSHIIIINHHDPLPKSSLRCYVSNAGLNGHYVSFVKCSRGKCHWTNGKDVLVLSCKCIGFFFFQPQFGLLSVLKNTTYHYYYPYVDLLSNLETL